MSHNLFHYVYDSESIGDLGRDVSECFDSRFNSNAEGLTENSIIMAKFIFKHEKKTVIMHNRSYSMESINDMEENLYDSLTDLDISDIPEYEGFFEGDMTLDISYTN